MGIVTSKLLLLSKNSRTAGSSRPKNCKPVILANVYKILFHLTAETS